MPSATEHRRRPDGWLKQRIFELLETADRPLSAQALALALRRRYAGIHHSAVFRSMRQLTADGAVDRVELAAGYLPRRPPAALAMICSRCGAYGEIAGAAPLEALARIAEEHGFTPIRYVAEVAGKCSDCMSALEKSLLTEQ